MKAGPEWAKRPFVGGVERAFGRFLDRLISLLEIPSPEAPQVIRRVQVIERDIMLPLKAAGILMLLYSFYFRPWFRNSLGALEIAVESTQYFLSMYVAANVVIAIVLLMMRRLPVGLVQWTVFVSCLLDGLILSALTLVTGGYDSFLYWLFLGLIVRGASSVTRATP